MVSSEDFGASFQAFMQQMTNQGAREEPVFLRRLREHFGCDPATLPIVSESFERYDHPNLHLAVEAYLADGGRSAELLGVTSAHQGYMGISLSQLVALPASGFIGYSGPTEGPVEHENITLGEDRVLACVKSGLYLIKDGTQPLAMMIDKSSEMGPYSKLKAEVMAPERQPAEALLGTIRRHMRQRNVYRGHIISLEIGEMHSLEIKFHRLPEIKRESIVLPDGLLDRVERQTIRFTRYSETLLKAGRHLKRGLLLHGSPGTGKTLTAMYVAGALKERTVLLVTGRGQGLIEQSCLMARTLQPAIVIVEDVDLIAEERTHDGCATPLLFELLNQMDGLADDADVLFLLTTNRPDLLEPALSARPGRVDQAIEIPLPDAACRKRLFDLYGHGLTLRLDDLASYIQRTEGASGAFSRELLRKAALFATDESQGQDCVVEDRHIEEGLKELVFDGGELTKSLLGFRAGSAAASDAPSP